MKAAGGLDDQAGASARSARSSAAEMGAGRPPTEDRPFDTGQVILVVSYHFAPALESGAKRFTFLASEWERLGRDVRVIAAPPAAGRACDWRLPQVKRIARVAASVSLPMDDRSVVNRVLNRAISVLAKPAGWEILWVRPAVRGALRLVKGCSRGVVIGTIPPIADALVAAEIAARKQWPLILDYRDPWTAYPWSGEARLGLSRKISARLERRCVARSAARVFNTPEMKDFFERYFPATPQAGNHVVPNGVLAPSGAPVFSGARNEIIYAGELYMDRSLLPVLRALKQLQDASVAHRDLRLVMYGSASEGHQALVRKEGLESLLQVRARVSQDRLTEVLRSARALLVVSGNEARYAIPNKVYEYLSSGRPILALAPAGTALYRFAQEFGSVVCGEPGNHSAVRRALDEVLARSDRTADPAQLQQLLWPTLAARYLHIVDKLLPEAAPAASISTRSG